MSRTNFLLSPQQRTDAREALKLLEGTGVSLVEAARRALTGKQSVKRVTVEDACSAFLLTRMKNRSATYDWYEQRLTQLRDAFGAMMLDSVGKAHVRMWLAELKTGDAAKAANARAARALWRWAMRQEPPLAADDPTLGLEFITKSRDGAAPTVLSPDQVLAIMTNGRHRDALALMLFAGIRPEEVAGDDKGVAWEDIDSVDRIIVVEPDVSKTKKRRPIEGLPPAIWSWLEKGEKKGRVCQVSARSVVNVAAQAAGYRTGKKWPQDCMRATFASYALALTGDPGKVALWLGHESNPTMLFRHYRGRASRADAEKFFALRPDAVQASQGDGQ